MQTVIATSLALLVTTILTSGQAVAQESDIGKRFYIGQGVTSCGAWTAARSTKSALKNAHEQWLTGFVSGANWTEAGPDFLAEPDFDALTAWVDNYCRAEPLAKVYTAATTLVRELRERAARR
jgi:hypothetical protein